MASPRSLAAPDRAALHEAALRHLARYAATEAGLVRVLDRRIARWLQASGGSAECAAAARVAAREVARALVGAGAIDDAAFAAARVRRLQRAGRSRRAVASHLLAKGVDPLVSGDALPEDDFPAAVAFVRRRRFGRFRPEDAALLQRELAALARAGFSHDVAERALAIAPDEAASLLLAMKQG